VAVKSGSMIHDINGFVVDRIQTGGVSNLNVNEEQIYELGNWSAVDSVMDIADLTFEIESLDVSTEIEGIFLGTNGTTDAAGTLYDFGKAMPIDVLSPFKSGVGAYNIVEGVIVPYLTLESATYRFGVRANATQTFTTRGDSVFYVRGTPKYQAYTASGTNYTFTDTALPYRIAGDTRYALSVCLKNATTGAYKRLVHGADYTDTSAGFTLTAAVPGTYNRVHVAYGTATAGTYGTGVHQGTDVKPAAVRGKDIDLYVGLNHATPTLGRWSNVQSVEFTRRVNLDNDEELGNDQYVASDYDVAEVTGNVVVRAATISDLMETIQQIAAVPDGEIIGPYTAKSLPLEARITHPDTGAVLKTIYVPDAKFTIPPIQGRVQQKLEVTIPWRGVTGEMYVYKGARA
jgi:hypothetical protein